MNEDAIPRTPVLLKTDAELQWPEDERMFYVLGSDGLHLCRNHPFFRSCVPATGGPGELEPQERFLESRFPIVPQDLFEQVVGFFAAVGELHGAEAAAMLYWDPEESRVRIVVPEQQVTVVRYSDGFTSPIGLFYQPPTDLPGHWVLFGDIHSHVNLSAYCSHTDMADEAHFPGVHIVVVWLGELAIEQRWKFSRTRRDPRAGRRTALQPDGL